MGCCCEKWKDDDCGYWDWKQDHIDSVSIIKELVDDDEYLTSPFSDRSDMIGWGLFASDAGILYGGHTENYDYYKYYHGKLEGVNRLLHYVSLFMKGESGFKLPELLTMQGRIMLEQLIENDLLLQSHSCYIAEQLLAENRITQEETE